MRIQPRLSKEETAAFEKKVKAYLEETYGQPHSFDYVEHKALIKYKGCYWLCYVSRPVPDLDGGPNVVHIEQLPIPISLE